MKRAIVATDKAPAAIGPYSQATSYCHLIFTSMQIAIDPQTGEIEGDDHAAQIQRCLMNVQAILEAADSSLAGALKVTVYLTDMAAFGAVNKVYEDFFPVEPPARGVVEVAELPRGALVAIDVVAARH